GAYAGHDGIAERACAHHPGNGAGRERAGECEHLRTEAGEQYRYRQSVDRGEVSADREPRSGVLDLPRVEERDEDREVLAGVSVRALVREAPHVFDDHAMRRPDAEREATPPRSPRR